MTNDSRLTENAEHAPRYGIRAKGSGWAVYDRQQTRKLLTGHDDPIDVAHFWRMDFGGSSDPESWGRAQRAAQSEADRLNEPAQIDSLEAQS